MIWSKSEKYGKSFSKKIPFSFETILSAHRMRSRKILRIIFLKKSEMDKIAQRNSEELSENDPFVTDYAVCRTQPKIFALVQTFFARRLNNKKEIS